VFFSPFDHFESLNHYQAWNIQLLGEIKRILRPNGQVYMFGSYLHLDWMIAMIKTLGFRYYKPLIWYKPDICGLFPNQYGCNYEIIHWFRKKSPQKCPYKVTNHIGCSQKDVFTHNSTHINDRREGGFHPTVKPVNLCRRFIKNSTNEGDLVFDPFAGSGTTLVAAKQTRRRYLGCEINPEYVETIKRRLQQENLLQIIQKNGDATLTL
jgi:site-specific DNA-methyltransferase (adenine-specific)